jgi:hypothetical protein
MDYIPILIIFLSALIGIFGKSWDESKKGIKRITPKGWITITLAVFSFFFAILTINSKNQRLLKISEIKVFAEKQIFEGTNYLIRHLVSHDLRIEKSNSEIFKSLKDTSYLFDCGKSIIINPDSSGLVFDGSNGGFIHSWELYAANIATGERILNDALVKYIDILEPETIILINEVLNDNFFIKKFKLKDAKMYFDEAIYHYKENHTYVAWSYLGLYYFDKVYVGTDRNPGNYADFIVFINKLEKQINKNRTNDILIFSEEFDFYR